MPYLRRSRFAHINLIFFHPFLHVIDQFVITYTKKKEKEKDELDAWMNDAT